MVFNQKNNVTNVEDIEKPNAPQNLLVDAYNISGEIKNNYHHVITDFIKIMNKNSNFDLSNFFENIKTLKIKNDPESFPENVQKFKKHIGNSLGGFYRISENAVYLWKDYSFVLYHELFHVASTPRTADSEMSITGFDQKINDKTIGQSLNEGYTNLLTKKYFDKNTIFYSSYYFESNVAEIIEEVIGQNKMLKYFSTANLSGLINELTKYASLNEVIQFLINFEKECKNFYSFSNGNYVFNKRAKEMHKFLLGSYMKKLSYDILNGEIYEEDYIYYIAKYCLTFRLDASTSLIKEILDKETRKELNEQIKELVEENKIKYYLK